MLTKETYKLVDHINKTVRNGFNATSRPDGSILLSFIGYDSDFEISLEFSREYNVWMIDPCMYAVRGNRPSIVKHKAQLGFITNALAKYNSTL